MSKCIVVEDDPFWSSEISAALLSADVEVIHAADGREALAMARHHQDASMVLDMILPDVDGVEVLQRLGAIAPDIAVLAVSGGGRLGPAFYLKLAQTFGAKVQLAKPFTQGQLVENWMALAA
ncbi:MAG: response regulator [Actinomycetota bacterium]|nr:response regulator [Actinomycetota bacterium]